MVEVIYPVDQAIGGAILVGVGQIYTVASVGMSRLLEEDLTAKASLLQVHLHMCKIRIIVITQVNIASRKLRVN